MTRGRSVRVFGPSLSRPPTRGEALLLHLFDQHVERLLDDRRHVSVRDSVAEQILRLAEFLMARPTRGELELEGFLSQRRNLRAAFIASRRGRR